MTEAGLSKAHTQKIQPHLHSTMVAAFLMGLRVEGKRKKDLLGVFAMCQTPRNNTIYAPVTIQLTPSICLSMFLSSWELANSHRAGSLGK